MHLGGWGAIEGEAVATYRAAGGAEIEPERLRYALRFERLRSILSGMQGLAARAAGRAHDPRLTDIGAAAQAGAWDLVGWLEPGLPPLDDVLAPPVAECPLHAEAPGDERSGWQDTLGELTERAATGGPEMIEPLRSLAAGDPSEAELPQVRWRDL